MVVIAAPALRCAAAGERGCDANTLLSYEENRFRFLAPPYAAKWRGEAKIGCLLPAERC